MTSPVSDPNSPSFWDRLYLSSQSHWDLGGPTPVFRRLAEGGRLAAGRMLVLGAGYGHDARMFAGRGFQVTAVDFSTEATAAMNRLDDPGSPVEVIQADFFSPPPAWSDHFDYLLDYTCFCAVLPERRPEYADMVKRLLKPGGRYIILAFPIGTRSGGPPFVVQPDDIIALYERRGFVLQYRKVPVDSVPSRKGYEELLIFESA